MQRCGDTPPPTHSHLAHNHPPPHPPCHAEDLATPQCVESLCQWAFPYYYTITPHPSPYDGWRVRMVPPPPSYPAGMSRYGGNLHFRVISFVMEIRIVVVNRCVLSICMYSISPKTDPSTGVWIPMCDALTSDSLTDQGNASSPR